MGDVRDIAVLRRLSPEDEERALRDELLRREAARAAANKHGGVLRDLAALGAYLPIKTKTQGTLPFAFERWHDEQRRFHSARTGRDLILKARQAGFSTIENARDVQFSRIRPGTQTLIVSHDADMAEQHFQAIHLMATGLVDAGLAPKPKYSTKREIVWGDNHSAIRVVEAGATETAASKKGRSGTIHRLHATEVAFWGEATETMTAVLAAAEHAEEITIESTANGAAGLFYELCTTALAGAGAYRLHFFPWFEHAEYRTAVPLGFDPAPVDADEERMRAAGCDDEQIAWWRAKLADPARGGRDKVKQEYPLDPRSCFRSPGGAYIETDAVEWMETKARPPIRRDRIVVKGRDLGELLVYAEPKQFEQYVIGGDVAEGTGLDASAADVSTRRTGRTVAAFASDSIEAGDFGLALAWIGHRYNLAVVAPERNNHGAATLRVLTQEASEVTPYPRIYTAEDGKLGWHTSPATRPPLFDELRMAIVDAHAQRDPAVLTPDEATIAECKTLVRDPKDGKPRARGKRSKGGAKDDRFVAKAISWQVRQRGDDSPAAESGARRDTAGLRGVW